MQYLLGVVVVAILIAVVGYIVFWPFLTMQDYFLFTEGIDKYSALPIVVGVIAQLFYLGSFAVAVAFWLSSTDASAQEESPTSDGSSSKHPNVGRRVLGASIFAGTAAILFMIVMSGFDRSGAEIHATFVDKCEEEVTGDRDAQATTYEQHRQVQDCVERKLDSM